MADPGDLVVTIRRFSSDGDAMVDFTVDLAGKPKDGAVPLDHGGCGEDFLGEAAWFARSKRRRSGGSRFGLLWMRRN